MKTKNQNSVGAHAGRDFDSSVNRQSHPIKLDKFRLSFEAGEVRLFIAEAFSHWAYHLGGGTEMVILTAYNDHIESGRPAVEWSSEGEFTELSRLVLDQAEVHGLEEAPKGDEPFLTASIWVEGVGGPVLRYRLPAYMVWNTKHCSAGSVLPALS